MPIQFVYFDVGGVLIKDFSQTDNWLVLKRLLGVTDQQMPAFEADWRQLKDQICIGLDIDVALPQLLKRHGLTPPPNFSFLTYFVDHFELNLGIWPLVEKLKQNYQLGLLTDMYPGMLQLIKSRGLLPPVQWTVEFDSSVEQLKKPSAACFARAQVQAGVQPAEILFIDNLEKNLAAAQQAGWQTFLYDSSNYETATKTLQAFISRLQP